MWSAPRTEAPLRSSPLVLQRPSSAPCPLAILGPQLVARNSWPCILGPQLLAPAIPLAYPLGLPPWPRPATPCCGPDRPDGTGVAPAAAHTGNPRGRPHPASAIAIATPERPRLKPAAPALGRETRGARAWPSR